MQIITHINNVKCLEWGLNANQGALFDMLYRADMSKKTYQEISFCRKQVINRLPVYFKKEDTVYRAYKTLAKKGLIHHECYQGVDKCQITKKGKEWGCYE